MSKGSNAEVEQRVFDVAKIMLGGMMRTSEIIRHCSEKKDWGVGSRQIENYIARAKEIIVLENKKDVDFERNLAINQLNDLIRKNLADENYREVRNCIKDKAGILGIIESRFKEKEGEKKSELKVVSRFADKWAKISKK